MTLYPYPREIYVEFDWKRSVGRKALRHPSSSRMRGSRRPNICKKELDEHIVRTTPRYDSDMHQMEIVHDIYSLNSIQ
jgi:hypothetical protein